MDKVVVVTGGSSGIGKAVCSLLAEKGCIVYELSRHGADWESVRHITADVTNEQSLASAVERVISEQGRLDALVNNAGFGISGAVETTPLEQAKKQLEVNFFGQVAATQACLPYLRQSRGRIVNISSVAALLPIPYQAFYSASKAAVDAFSLALANELRPFGVRVSAVLPGDVCTGFTAAREKAADSSNIYGDTVKQAVAAMEKDEINGMPPRVVAQRVWRALVSAHPQPLYVAGNKYRFFAVLGKLLPRRTSNWIVSKMYS